MIEKITSYKGFNKDMTCRDFQYKEGESYEEPSAKACERGFHACEYPLDCLNYYTLDKKCADMHSFECFRKIHKICRIHHQLTVWDFYQIHIVRDTIVWHI